MVIRHGHVKQIVKTFWYIERQRKRMRLGHGNESISPHSLEFIHQMAKIIGNRQGCLSLGLLHGWQDPTT